MSYDSQHIPDMVGDYGTGEQDLDNTQLGTPDSLDWGDVQHHFAKNPSPGVYSEEASGEYLGVPDTFAYAQRYPSLDGHKLKRPVPPLIQDLIGRVNLNGVTDVLFRSLVRGGYLLPLTECDQERLARLGSQGVDVDLNALLRLNESEGGEFFANYVESYLLFDNSLPAIIVNSLLDTQVFQPRSEQQ